MQDVKDKISSIFANPNRIRILSLLTEKPYTLTKLTEALGNTSNPVVSRQLARLAEYGLVEKESVTGREYMLSSFGNILVEFLDPLEFLFQHQLFFQEHTVDVLPGFLQRDLVALKNATMITGTGDVIVAIKRLLEGADHSIAGLIESAFGNVNNKIKKIKLILQSDMYSNPDLKNRMGNLSTRLRWEDIDIRIIPTVSLTMAIFDDGKSGLIIFPRKQDYKPDFSIAFEVKDKQGMEFLKKVWDFYWEQAKPP